jgi:hypothetical protein
MKLNNLSGESGQLQTSWQELEPQFLDAERAAKGIATEATRAILTETIKKLIALRGRIPH